MSLIQWDSSYSVNVELIDEQHKILVTMINDLYDAMNDGKEKEFLKKLINKISVYAAMHFAREENYFDMFGYPDAERHKKNHLDFEDKVTEFEDDFAKGRQDLSMDIMKFLSDWLLAHIKGSDQKYTSFLNERGVK